MIFIYLYLPFRNCLLLSIPHFPWENQSSQRRIGLAGLHAISLFINSFAKYVLSIFPMPGTLLATGVRYRCERDRQPHPPPPWSCHLVGRQMINKSTERKELLVVKVLFIPEFLRGQWIWAWHWGSTNDPGRRGPYPMWNFAEPRLVCRLLLPAQSVPFNHSPWTGLYSREADDTGNPKGLSLPSSIFSTMSVGVLPDRSRCQIARGLTRNTAVREKGEGAGEARKASAARQIWPVWRKQRRKEG